MAQAPDMKKEIEELFAEDFRAEQDASAAVQRGGRRGVADRRIISRSWPRTASSPT